MRICCGSFRHCSTRQPLREQVRTATVFLHFDSVNRNCLRRFTISGGAHAHRRLYHVTRSLVDAALYEVPQVLHAGASFFFARFNRPSLLEFHGIKCISSNIGKTPWDHKRDHNEKNPFVLLLVRVLHRLATIGKPWIPILWGLVLESKIAWRLWQGFLGARC